MEYLSEEETEMEIIISLNGSFGDKLHVFVSRLIMLKYLVLHYKYLACIGIECECMVLKNNSFTVMLFEKVF